MAAVHLARARLVARWLVPAVAAGTWAACADTPPEPGDLSSEETHAQAAPPNSIVIPADERLPSVTRNGDSLSLDWGSLGDLTLTSVTSHPSEERWTRANVGVRQSWLFNSAPAEGDDIVVTVRIDDAEVAAVRPDGLEIELESGARLLYGGATWIDATGTRFDFPPVPIDGGIELRVPSRIIQDSAFPALLDPVLSPSADPEPPYPVDIPSPNLYQPVVACGPTSCLATYEYDNMIRAVRVQDDGTVLDPLSTMVVDQVSFGHSISAAGDHYVMAWCGSGLKVGLVSSAGQLIGPPASVFPACYQEVEVVANDEAILVIARQSQFSPEVNYALLAPDLSIITPATQLPGSPGQYNFEPSSAETDGQDFIFLATYGGEQNWVFAFPSDGSPYDILPSPGLGYDRRVAWDGTQYLASRLHVLSPSFLIDTFDPSGALINGGVVVHPTAVFRPALACRGSDCLAVWHEHSRAIQNGVPVGAPNFDNDFTSASFISLEPSPAGFQVLQNYNQRIRWSPVNLAGEALLEPFAVLSDLANRQTHSAAAMGSTSSLLVWRNEAEVSARALRFGADGIPDGTAFSVPLGSSTFNPATEVAGGGGRYAIAAFDEGKLALLDELSVVPDAPIDIPSAVSGSLAWNGASFTLAWQSASDVLVRRLDSAGAWVDPAASVLAGQAKPRVTPADGGGAWLATKVTNSLVLRRLAPDGTIGAPVTLTSAAQAHDVAWGTSSGLAVWLQGGGIYGRRFDPSGAPLGAAFEIDPPTNDLQVRVTWDGAAFFVAWGDGTPCEGRRVLPTGAFDGPAFTLALPGCQNLARIPNGSASQVLVAGNGMYKPYARERVRYLIASDDLQLGTACTSGGDCASSLCVDGVCCDVACGNGDSNDCQACSVAAGAPTNGTCAPIAAGTLCRASSGQCDVAETCDGSAMSCPADGFAPSTVGCRASVGECDVEETCTGAGPSCPVDGFAPNTTSCRVATGDCDVEDFCTGAAAGCPSDIVATAGTTCRPASGACDAAESCDGVAKDCPVDAPAPAATECRAANGLCDVAETCGGAFACPPDGFEAAGVSCRASAHDCDVEDFCDGTSAACDNEGAPADTPCGGSPSGACDLQDTCEGGPGNTNECVDWVYNENFTCRESAGECDVAENCTATGYNCPADQFATGETCRASSGACDAEEQCDGSGADCPTDAPQPDGTECGDALVCSAGECVPGSTGEGGSDPTSGSSGSGGKDDDDDGDGNSDGGAEDGEDGGGCSCRTAGRADGTGWAWGAIGIVIAVRTRRRRRAA